MPASTPSSSSGRQPTQPLTVTHARLRVAQGDFTTARRILRELLEQRPDDGPAWALWREINEARNDSRARDGREAAAPPVAATAAGLAGEFREALGGPARRRSRAERVSRLGSLLRRIRPEAE